MIMSGAYHEQMQAAFFFCGCNGHFNCVRKSICLICWRMATTTFIENILCIACAYVHFSVYLMEFNIHYTGVEQFKIIITLNVNLFITSHPITACAIAHELNDTDGARYYLCVSSFVIPFCFFLRIIFSYITYEVSLSLCCFYGLSSFYDKFI